MLLVGPPRSGKTSTILAAIETAIRARRSDQVLVLVPTASMRNHLLNLLARKGLMVPTRVVSTMTEFVSSFTRDAQEAGPAVQDRLLQSAIEQAGTPAHRALAGSSGLRDRLAAVIRECWAAGADGFQMDAVARTRQHKAFADILCAFEESLGKAGFLHRDQRIALAAARVREEGLGPLVSVYLDGFDNFSMQQQELLKALEKQAEEIVVAMPEGLRRYPLPDSKTERLPETAPRPPTETVRAGSPRTEMLEIARRILSSSRPLREHAIILHSPSRYLDDLQEVFESLEIPYRYWADRPLAEHPAARHLLQWLKAAERQFPGEETIEALTSPLTPSGGHGEQDAFDFEARSLLPDSGLAFLRAAARDLEGPRNFLEAVRELADWASAQRSGKAWRKGCAEWIDRLQQVPAPPGGAAFRRLQDWRRAAAARKALLDAVRDTKSLPDCGADEVLPLSGFVAALEQVLRFNSLREPGNPYDVVQVLPTLESRQWSVPVAYVCGLAEGWLPRSFGEDPLFDDEDRRQIKERGIDLRTSADRAEYERYLFGVATSRATERLVLTYPLHDSQGRPVTRSTLLEGFEEPLDAPWVRVGDSREPSLASAAAALPSALRTAVAERNPGFSVSGIANYQQCPYLYFSGNTLKLRGRPAPPDRRLDSAVTGEVVHASLLAWNRDRGGRREIGRIVDETFRARLRGLRLPTSFRTEQARLAIRADLVRFVREQGAHMSVCADEQAFFENAQQYRVEELSSSPVVHCRIDRYELDSLRRCFVTDYKYSSPGRVKAMVREHLKGERLQLLIYLAALEQELRCEPSGLALCGLRGQTCFEGAAVGGAGGLRKVTQSRLRKLLATARAETAEVVEEILGGSIAVRPKDRGFCARFCSFGSVCRVDWQPPDESGGGG